MEVMGALGVMVNCALIGQSDLVQRIWPDMSPVQQLLFVVVLEVRSSPPHQIQIGDDDSGWL